MKGFNPKKYNPRGQKKFPNENSHKTARHKSVEKTDGKPKEIIWIH
jgi:hypothetical protein